MARQKAKVKEVSEGELRQQLKGGKGGGGSEHRGAPRLPAQWEVEVPLSTWEQVRRVYTMNISKGGLMFSVVPPATIPAVLTLTVSLPDGRTLKFDSEVRHVARREGTSEFDVGVQFAPLDDETRKLLDKALANLPSA